MRVVLRLAIEGDDLVFGTSQAEARAALADRLEAIAARLRASNDPRVRVDICDDVTGEPLGHFSCLIQEGR